MTTTQANKKVKKSGPKKKKAPKVGEGKQPPHGNRKLHEFEKYALFIALPAADRKEFFGIYTDRQFGKKFGVNAGTLSEWKWDPKLWEARDKYMIHFKKHTAKILGALAKRAERTGEAFHTLSYMKLVEGFTEKSGLDLTSKGQPVKGFEVIIRHAKHSPTSSRDGDGDGAGK